MHDKEVPVDRAKLPKHMAIIMDGNGRWAQMRGLPRSEGHRQGVNTIRHMVRVCGQYGIKVLTLFAFSTENWARPKAEVDFLMGLIEEFFTKEIGALQRDGVCLRVLGDVEALPKNARNCAKNAMEATKDNTAMYLNVALNYGGRAEIIRAAQALARQAAQGQIAPEDIDQARFEQALYTFDLPDVDLLIRTSGEMRVSNFLLYQIAYAEFVALDCLWPDFDEGWLQQALALFAGRNRRFGGIESK